MLLASVPADDLEPPERHRFCSGDATLVLDGTAVIGDRVRGSSDVQVVAP